MSLLAYNKETTNAVNASAQAPVIRYPIKFSNRDMIKKENIKMMMMTEAVIYNFIQSYQKRQII